MKVSNTKQFYNSINNFRFLATSFALVSISTFCLQSCKKTEDTPAATTTTTTAPTNPTIQISDADAIFISLNTVSYTSIGGISVETSIGLPVAMFLEGSKFKDVGTVTCEGSELTKQPNNSYIFMPSVTSPLGVSYSGDIEWDVTGGNGFPAYNYDSQNSFPKNVELNIGTGEIIDINSAFTLTTKNSISNADSIYFGVYGPEGTVMFTHPSSVSSHTFSASEMQSLGTGAGFVQIAAVKQVHKKTLPSGEKAYFLTEKVATETVTLK